jgi:RimJ/RimL family protein N-acetyltransferase
MLYGYWHLIVVIPTVIYSSMEYMKTNETRNEGVAVRIAKPEDAQGFIDHWIEIACEPDIYVSYTPEEANVSLEKERETIRKQIEAGNLYLVAEAKDKIIAHLICTVDHSYAITRHIAVLGMSVSREYRNQGIGTEMMKEAIKWARGNGIVRLELEVYADNAPAVHLYKKFGFEVEGRKRKYAYQRGKYYDSLIMSRLFA